MVPISRDRFHAAVLLAVVFRNSRDPEEPRFWIKARTIPIEFAFKLEAVNL